MLGQPAPTDTRTTSTKLEIGRVEDKVEAEVVIDPAPSRPDSGLSPEATDYSDQLPGKHQDLPTGAISESTAKPGREFVSPCTAGRVRHPRYWVWSRWSR